MFLASFENKNKNEINYIYKDKNNKYIGLNINKNGIGNFDYESFNYFINNLKFNKDCIKLYKYNDYDVYFNPLTNYNHYIKNGKEDYLMFYLKNGNDGLLYLESKKSKKSNSIIKCFFVGCVTFLCFNIIFENILNLQISDIIDYKVYTNDNNISYATYIDYENISANDYVDKIMCSSNLSESEKELLSNKQLLEDIIPYYNDKYSNIVINSKLNDINIKFFPAEELDDVEGAYNCLDPNTIYISDKYKYPYDIPEIVEKRKKILIHEYIHLLQSNSEYNYLKEGTSHIISNEYYDIPLDKDNTIVNNTKLLIDIIGPEPILKSMFANDSEELENILADNLSLNQYKKIIDYFKSNTTTIDEKINDEIRNILCILYRNIYGTDIKEDSDILYDLFYSKKYQATNNKVYLNKSKMLDIEEYDIYVNGTPQQLVEKGFMNVSQRKTITRVISLERYYELIKQNRGMNCTYYFTSDNIEHFEDCYLINDTNIVTFDQAVKLGYIVIQETDSIGINEEVPYGWNYAYIINDYIINFDNVSFNFASQESTCFRVVTNGLKSRFTINYNFGDPIIKTYNV